MAYGSDQGFKDYHLARGRVVPLTWNVTSIRLVASEWLDGTYGSLWIGTPTGGFTQERQWPRTGATTTTNPPYTFPDDEIPEQVVNATYEAGWHQGMKPGSLTVDFNPFKYKSVSVDGAVAVEYNLAFTSSADLQMQIVTVQRLMAALLRQDAGMSALSGAAIRV